MVLNERSMRPMRELGLDLSEQQAFPFKGATAHFRPGQAMFLPSDDQRTWMRMGRAELAALLHREALRQYESRIGFQFGHTVQVRPRPGGSEPWHWDPGVGARVLRRSMLTWVLRASPLHRTVLADATPRVPELGNHNLQRHCFWWTLALTCESCAGVTGCGFCIEDNHIFGGGPERGDNGKL